MNDKEELVELLYSLNVPFAASVLAVLEEHGYMIQKKEDAKYVR